MADLGFPTSTALLPAYVDGMLTVTALVRGRQITDHTDDLPTVRGAIYGWAVANQVAGLTDGTATWSAPRITIGSWERLDNVMMAITDDEPSAGNTKWYGLEVYAVDAFYSRRYPAQPIQEISAVAEAQFSCTNSGGTTTCTVPQAPATPEPTPTATSEPTATPLISALRGVGTYVYSPHNKGIRIDPHRRCWWPWEPALGRSL